MVVNVNIVVLGIGRLLDEGLRDLEAVDLELVASLAPHGSVGRLEAFGSEHRRR